MIKKSQFRYYLTKVQNKITNLKENCNLYDKEKYLAILNVLDCKITNIMLNVEKKCRKFWIVEVDFYPNISIAEDL